jgi:hypothetical protein
MEKVSDILRQRLEARKTAASLFELGKLPDPSLSPEVCREVYLRHIADNPIDGLYAYIRYLAAKNCPGCHPNFKFTKHDERGCMSDDGMAIDTYLNEAFKSLDLAPVIPGTAEALKTKYRAGLADMLNAQGIGENDPLTETLRLVHALMLDGSPGELAHYLLHRRGRDIPRQEFSPVKEAINDVVKLLKQDGLLANVAGSLLR